MNATYMLSLLLLTYIGINRCTTPVNCQDEGEMLSMLDFTWSQDIPPLTDAIWGDIRTSNFCLTDSDIVVNDVPEFPILDYSMDCCFESFPWENVPIFRHNDLSFEEVNQIFDDLNKCPGKIRRLMNSS